MIREITNEPYGTTRFITDSDIDKLTAKIGEDEPSFREKRDKFPNTSFCLSQRAHFEAGELAVGPKMPPNMLARAFTEKTVEAVLRSTSFIAQQCEDHRVLHVTVEMTERLMDVWASLQGTSPEVVRVDYRIDSFFTELDELVHTGRKSRALDHIYTILDTWMLESQSDLVTEVLSRVVVNKYDMYVLIGLLTITLDWKTSLPKRSDFYKDIRERAERERGKEQAERLLLGLE